ncbi:hypothetical protein ACQR35_03600 [Pseudarthrobacter sp. J1738]|uniref:hypothetical protein n=1 Tax=Pseudarthrobacter sp. J1738 TaxID=3420446 RepID=UPI003D2B4269
MSTTETVTSQVRIIQACIGSPPPDDPPYIGGRQGFTARHTAARGNMLKQRLIVPDVGRRQPLVQCK